MPAGPPASASRPSCSRDTLCVARVPGRRCLAGGTRNRDRLRLARVAGRTGWLQPGRPAAQPGHAGPGAGARAWPIGVVCPQRRAGRTTPDRPPPRGATWPAAACGGADTAARREWRPLGLDRGGWRATAPASSGLACPGRSGGRVRGSDSGRQRPTEGGTLATEGSSGQGLSWPTYTDRARPAPTAGDPHRQSRGRGNGREEREGIARRAADPGRGRGARARGRERPEIRRTAASPAGGRVLDAALATSSDAVSPYSVVRVWV